MVFCDFDFFGATLCGNPTVECQKLRVFCDFFWSGASLSGKTRVECQKLRVFCDFGVPEFVLRIVLTTRFATYGRFPQQRKLKGSSAQISSGVFRCGSQEQVPEAGSGRFRCVLVVPESSGVCWCRFRGRFRRVPVCAGGSGEFRCVLVYGPGSKFRKVPESSGVCWCRFRMQVPEGSGEFRCVLVVPESSGGCYCRFRSQLPEGSGEFWCVLL